MSSKPVLSVTSRAISATLMSIMGIALVGGVAMLLAHDKSIGIIETKTDSVESRLREIKQEQREMRQDVRSILKELKKP